MGEVPPVIWRTAVAQPRAPHQVTKKITLKMKCEKCSTIKMKNLGRCKHFELGAEKKKKGPTVSPPLPPSPSLSLPHHTTHTLCNL